MHLIFWLYGFSFIHHFLTVPWDTYKLCFTIYSKDIIIFIPLATDFTLVIRSNRNSPEKEVTINFFTAKKSTPICLAFILHFRDTQKQSPMIWWQTTENIGKVMDNRRDPFVTNSVVLFLQELKRSRIARSNELYLCTYKQNLKCKKCSFSSEMWVLLTAVNKFSIHLSYYRFFI